ncbi:MAG: iron-sulfur cluster repair di-iron protein [Candidatus Cyclobacteriaceae bacterium M2_1C_046]
MQITTDKTLGEMVAEDYRTALIFRKYNIDFCCNGNRTIAEACEKKKAVNEEQVLAEIAAIKNEGSAGSENYNSWPLDLLADYIEKKHHRYVEARSLEIKPLLYKLCKVHGERHPELLEIYKEFLESTGELAAHMKKEEFIVFPYIRKMVEQRNIAEKPAFGTVQNPIQVMMDEHSSEGERFRKISEITNGYNPPADACNTYRVTFALLKEFEEDLHLHIHLENNILFPKAIEMEKKLQAQNV